MSSFSMGRCICAIAFALAISLTNYASCADPKVVRASHTQTAKEDIRATANAQSDEEKTEDLSYSPQWPEPPNTGMMLMKLCGGTVVVLCLCVGTLWFGKPWLQKLQVAGAGNAAMQIEGSVAVGNRAMLYLVRVGGIQLVAGTDATGLKSLIALPPSFKDVLDEQVPDPESQAFDATRPAGAIEKASKAASILDPVTVGLPRTAALRSFNRPDSKE